MTIATSTDPFATWNAMASFVGPPGARRFAGTSKTVDDILESATPGRVTKGKTTLYEKLGDFGRASNEFDSLNPSNVKNIVTKYGVAAHVI
jgi:hypothetical protein